CDHALKIDDTALVAAADLDVGIDDHDGLDLWRQRAKQVTESPRLVALQPRVEASPAGLAQAFRSVIGGPVADEPDVIAIRLQPLHELLELIFEIEYERNDCGAPSLSGPDAAASSGREINRQPAQFASIE